MGILAIRPGEDTHLTTDLIHDPQRLFAAQVQRVRLSNVVLNVKG